MYVHLPALGAIPTVEQVEAWLASHGWEQFPDPLPIIWRTWAKRAPAPRHTPREAIGPDGLTLRAVGIPLRVEAHDHSRSMWGALSDVCEIDRRAIWQVLPEMRGEHPA